MASFLFRLTILLSITILHTQCQSIFKPKTMKVDRMLGRCLGFRNLTVYLENVSIRHIKDIFVYSAKIVITKETSSDLKQRIKIERCRSKEALDSCEPYPAMGASNLCSMINSQLPPFIAFKSRIQPEISCPFKKGVYKLTNGTEDAKILGMLPLEGLYLRIRSELLDNIDGTYKVIGCIYTECRIVALNEF